MAFGEAGVTGGALAGVALIAGLSPAFADPKIPPAEPVVAVDDTRSHAAVLGEDYQLAAAAHYVFSRDGRGDLETVQAAIGPLVFDEQHLNDTLSWTRKIALRARFSVADVTKDDMLAGPLTFGLQRYMAIAPLAISPLLHVHAGFEVAVSTPWLEGREVVPPSPIHAASLVDTELASNGWSLRPFSTYFRLDLLLCRSIYGEAGVAPEAFVPTMSGDRSTEYGLRVHAAGGISLACLHERDGWLRGLDLVLEYRGRARLYKSGDPSSYYNTVNFEVQHRGPTTYGISVFSNCWTFIGLGIRVQLGGR